MTASVHWGMIYGKIKMELRYLLQRMFVRVTRYANIPPLLNSVLLSVFSCVGAIVYGGMFAYLVTRTNMRCKKSVSYTHLDVYKRQV